MHALKRFGFLILLWVASVHGIKSLAAAPIPQAEGQEKAGAAHSGFESDHPWETPTGLSLFFSDRIESKADQFRALIETASALRHAGQQKFAVSVLMQAADVAVQTGPVEIVEVAAALNEAGRPDQANRLVALGLELAKQKSEMLRRLLNSRLLPALARAGAITETFELAEEINAKGGGISMIGIDGKIEQIRYGNQLLLSAASGLLRDGRGDDALMILRRLAERMTLEDNPQTMPKLLKMVDDAIGKTNDLDSLKQASIFVQQADDAYQKATLFRKIAHGLALHGDFDSAKVFARQSEATISQVPQPQRNTVRSAVAVVLAESGDVDRAIDLAHKIETVNGTSSTLTQIALTIAGDDRDRAIAMLEEATKLADGIESTTVNVSLRLQTAMALMKVGERAQAMATLKPAIEKSKEPKFPSYLLVSLGGLVAEAGDKPSAREILDRAVDAAKGGKDASMKAITLGTIASAIAKVGDDTHASSVLELATEFAQQIENPRYRTMRLHSLANVVGQAEEQQVKTLELATASAKEITDSGAKGMVLRIATDLAKRGELERAKRAMGPFIYTGDRVAALQTLAERLGASGKREESLKVISQTIDLAARIKGERSYQDAISGMARTLSTEPSAGPDAVISMKASFTQKERALAQRLVRAAQRENRFLQNLSVAVIAPPKLQSRPGLRGSTSQFWRQNKQTGLLRIEGQGDDLVVTGWIGNLRPGEHEIMIERPTVSAVREKSYSSSFSLPQTSGSQPETGVRLKLTPTASVDVERLGTAVAEESGTMGIQLTLAGKSIGDISGRALFIRTVMEDTTQAGRELSNAVVGWGFVIKPHSDLARTDEHLWKRVFPEVRASDLPSGSDPFLAEMIQLRSKPRGMPGRLANRSAANGSIELNGRKSFLSTTIRHDGKQPITLEAWVTPDDLAGHREVISNAQGGGVVLGFYDGTCKFIVHDGSRYREVAATEPMNAKTIAHIAGVFDGKRMTLFVDGRKQGTALLSGPGKASRFPFLIGADPEANRPPIKFFSGELHEVRISGSARYQGEFVPKRVLAPDGDTIAAYSFSDGSGEIARDASGNGFDAKLSGTKWIGKQSTKQHSFAMPTVSEKFWNTPGRFALFAADNLKPPQSKAHALLRTALDFQVAGDQQRAMTTARRSLQAAKQIKDTRSKLSVLPQIGSALLRVGEREEAIVVLKEAQDIVDQLRASSPNQLTATRYSLVGIATAFIATGEVDAAMKLADELDDSNLLNIVVEALIDAGHKTRASMLLKRMENLSRESTDEKAKQRGLSQVASKLADAGDIEPALAMILELEDPSQVTTVMVRVAAALRRAGDAEQAKSILSRAHSMSERIATPRIRSDALLAIASASEKNGDQKLSTAYRDEAIELAEQSYNLIKKIDRESSRQRYLLLIAQTFDRAGKEEQALAALKAAADALLAPPQTPPNSAGVIFSSTTTPSYRVQSLASTAGWMSKCGDRELAAKTLESAFEVAQTIERASSYSREDPRANAMSSLAQTLSHEQVEPSGSAGTYRMKASFTPLELTLAENLAQEGVRAERIASVREQLRTPGVSSTVIARLANDPDPEIAWMAAMSDFKKRSISLYRADRVTIERLIEDLKTLFANRKFDREAKLAADSLLRSLSRTEHQDLLASLYQFVGETMSESNDRGLRSGSAKMLGMARRLNLVGNEMLVSGTTVDGKEFDWDAYRGKVVLVDFWASWCAPCRKEHRSIKRNLEKYGDKGFAVVGINIDNDMKACMEYIETQGLTWPILGSNSPRERGVNQPVAARYAITVSPTCILVDRDGKVVSLNARGAELEAMLKGLPGKLLLNKAEQDDGDMRSVDDRSNPLAGLHASSTRLADIYSRQGELDKAISQYREVLRRNPAYAPAHRGLGDVLNKQGKLEEALKEFRTAIKLDPTVPIAQNNLAWALVTHPQEDGRYRDVPEAVAAAKKACELDLDNDAYLNTLGVALYRNGDWKQAIAALQDSVDLGADIPHNWLFIAMSQWQLGNKKQARALYDKSIAWSAKNKADQELQSFMDEADKLLGPRPQSDAAMPSSESEHGDTRAVPKQTTTRVPLSQSDARTSTFTKKTISLRNRDITGDDLKRLASLTGIHSLNLSGTSITDAEIEQLKGLRTLRALYLGNTKITNQGLKHLQSHDLQKLGISISGIEDTGLKHLMSFRNLEWLNLAGASITDAGIEQILELSKLQSLDLTGNPVTDEGVARLVELPLLRELHLARTRVGRRGLVSLAETGNLLKLVLNDTALDDTDLEALKDLKGLRSLQLKNTLVTEAGVSDLRRALPRCSILFDADDISRPESSHRYRAQVYLRKQNWGGARRAYRGVLASSPTDRRIWMELLDVAWWDDWTHGRPLDAVMDIYKESQQALGGDRRDLEILFVHAGWCLLADQRDEYERLCRAAAADHIGTDDPRTQYLLSWLLALGNEPVVDPIRLVEIAQESVRGAPNQKYHQKALAISLMRAGQPDTAVAHCPTHASRALAHALSGSHDDAKESLGAFQTYLQRDTLDSRSTAHPHGRVARRLYLRETETILGMASTLDNQASVSRLSPDFTPPIRLLFLNDQPIADAELAHLLKGLTQLEELHLFATRVGDENLLPLNRSPKLKVLWLGKTRVASQGLTQLRGLQDLRLLGLEDTQVDDTGVEQLQTLSKLELLNLRNTLVTDAGLKTLGKMKALGWLDLGSTKVTDAGLANLGGLDNLHSLYLHGTSISDVGLAHLKPLTNLLTLDLGETQITDEGLAHLKEAMKLTRLDLGFSGRGEAKVVTSITGPGLVNLSGMTSLKQLFLGDTPIDDAGLLHLPKLNALEEIYLNRTKVTDASMASLAKRKSLRVLHLVGTQVTDEGITQLQGLDNLQRLWLYDTRVTDEGVQGLQKHIPRCEIKR